MKKVSDGTSTPSQRITHLIDFHEGDVVDRTALKRLVSAAVAYNEADAK